MSALRPKRTLIVEKYREVCAPKDHTLVRGGHSARSAKTFAIDCEIAENLAKKVAIDFSQIARADPGSATLRALENAIKILLLAKVRLIATESMRDPTKGRTRTCFTTA